MKHIIIVGGGHAGCEAALAAAHLGQRVTLFALSLDSIALMPCNPCIGGSAKGHLVREIDALGGRMGKAIDATFIQSRMLNASKGPAVYSLRAQADKQEYMTYMKQVLENEPLISLREGEIVDILTKDGKVTGAKTESGMVMDCDAVVICTGTYLNARCLYGETVVNTGPNGLRASNNLSDSLKRLGFHLQRFKTGTPARVHRRSIDFSQMAIQPGDEKIVPFSFETDPEDIAREQQPCYLTYTNQTTHDMIQASIHRSAMYSGLIQATGTRYCPSIEDKIVRFADKDRHQVFIEPEGLSTEEMYVQGMSSALPEEVQTAVYRTIPGLENCEIMRPAYAIEYDCIDATQLSLRLEAKHIKGLYFAGQINGSSGYEEAAAQGLMAGLNAAGADIVLDRAEGYIGVLIDDLVTKGTQEPYRMMTSRSEYRLLLRQDNADLRLTGRAYDAGNIPQARYDMFLEKAEAIEAEITRLAGITVSPSLVNGMLAEKGSALLTTGAKVTDLIKRPEINYWDVLPFLPPRQTALKPDNMPAYIWDAVCEQVNIQIKYEGYISIQMAQAEAFRKMESRPLPPDIDYESIAGLRLEARQKLNALRPENFGQASRVTGVSPADLSILMVYLKGRQ
ncbi:MAG: tRNA uridine-5-carboxymethylaminomethyl(34) synthesis enzyme MnmG [Defluviitaleaceae bacterium]|nr:tRNA uridine-5-carboxymethylaminomethyl(34) synthesis enzyme MnmG [Defluviitaleaceae bacterium]